MTFGSQIKYKVLVMAAEAKMSVLGFYITKQEG